VTHPPSASDCMISATCCFTVVSVFSNAFVVWDRIASRDLTCSTFVCNGVVICTALLSRQLAIQNHELDTINRRSVVHKTDAQPYVCYLSLRLGHLCRLSTLVCNSRFSSSFCGHLLTVLLRSDTSRLSLADLSFSCLVSLLFVSTSAESVGLHDVRLRDNAARCKMTSAIATQTNLYTAVLVHGPLQRLTGA
jgi:hypothetical protein